MSSISICISISVFATFPSLLCFPLSYRQGTQSREIGLSELFRSPRRKTSDDADPAVLRYVSPDPELFVLVVV
ncbi:hypothetical protein MUK42_35766 [Musa troglodytarum]|uniref:Secreted protein n=1 Tax=Musa troglodytarum TaxID=320322 RepID=A0A9E7JVU3_9LILI|nr:hypothetical protein MUK42_35766 [Musa troglodytarum]